MKNDLLRNLLALDQNKNLYIIEPSCCQIFKVNDVYQELLEQQFRSMSILDDGEQKLIIGQTENNRIKAFINLACKYLVYKAGNLVTHRNSTRHRHVF